MDFFLPHLGKSALVLSLMFACVAVPAQKNEATPDAMSLFKQERFAELEKLLKARMGAYERDVRGEEQGLSDTFEELGSVDRALQGKFDRWIAEFPLSYSARLARATHLRVRATTVRGTDYAANTPPDDWDAMKLRLAQARNDLLGSLKLTGKPVQSYVELIVIGQYSGAALRNRDFMDSANRLAPANILAKEAYLLALRPQWGGSLEAMEAFIKESRSMPISEADKKRLESHKWRALARRSRMDNDHRSATKYYSTALALREDPLAYFNRGLSYYSLHEFENASSDFGKTILMEPKNAKAYLWRGLALRDMKDDDGALEDFSRAWQLDPNDMYAISNRGFIYGRREQFARAVPDLQIAADLGEDRAQHQLGLLYWYGKHVKGDKSKAIELWKAAARKGNKEALRELEVEGIKP